MSYGTDWRTRVAEQPLTESELSRAEIGEQVGYDSEWSFAKVFKRVFGQRRGAARPEAAGAAPESTHREGHRRRGARRTGP